MANQTRKRPAAKTERPKTVDDYIAAAPADRRAALTRLRKTIKAAAPRAIERISYGIVGYKHKGRSLAYFGYWKSHYALYGFGSSYVAAHAAELEPYDLSKGTLRFTANNPLPDRLVTKIVKARVAEIEKEGA